MYGHRPRFRPGGGPGMPAAQKPKVALERIDCAVAKAHRDFLATGESVSAWEVSQAALLTLQMDSWSSLGFQMQKVPSLHRLILTEGKINAFIHCFVAVRRIISLYDLEVAICKNEGVEQFEELKLGPLVRHPLVVHYFSVNSDVTEVYKITSEEIISYLCKFMDTSKNKKIKAEEFLDFISKKRLVTGREKLGVRIQSLGIHISSIWEARRLEGATLKKCGKHKRFVSSSSEDDDSNDHKSVDNNHARSHCEFSLQSFKSCDRVSSCAYPSAIEVMTRLGLMGETDAHPSLDSSSFRYNESKRKVKKINSMKNFMTMWKVACREETVDKVLERVLQLYHIKGKRRNKMSPVFSSYPCAGLLNLAVTSIKCGIWDNIYDTFEAMTQHGLSNKLSDTNSKNESIDVEPSEKNAIVIEDHISGRGHRCSEDNGSYSSSLFPSHIAELVEHFVPEMFEEDSFVKGGFMGSSSSQALDHGGELDDQILIRQDSSPMAANPVSCIPHLSSPLCDPSGRDCNLFSANRKG